MEFERRVGDRLTRIFPVLLAGESVHALDVSPTGVRVVCTHALAAEDEVALVLELEPDLRLDFTGRPVWQQELNRAGHHVVGLTFLQGDQRLESWIHEQQDAA